MSVRRNLFDIVGAVVAAMLLFSLGSYTARQGAERQLASRDRQIASLEREMGEIARQLKQEQTTPSGTAGLAEQQPAVTQATVVEEVKRQLQAEMGLLPVQLLRDRRKSFVELYAYDNNGRSNYGTAGYLGNGYFVTVKHAVVALHPGEDDGRRIVSVKLRINRKDVLATVVDAGDARTEVDPGDWAILRVPRPVNLPPLRVNLGFSYDFADPIFRLGNDYSKGIILSTGYIGQRTANDLVTCLTDGHPGVSGGGVLDQRGELVGIPIGRMQGDYRFSFILPLRKEIFRKVPTLHLSVPPVEAPTVAVTVPPAAAPR
ncbi:MAG: trypsin-like peptidase domain-containing protein [Acidobacteria bacterium]|nr:trypsin-like peptidase domain-containing protein [Acidobacteriota bacterium]